MSLVRDHQLDEFVRDTATKRVNDEMQLHQRNPSRTMRVVARPMILPNDDVVVMVLIRDVTQINQLERARRDMIVSISHELRTPLAALKILSDTIVSQPPPEVAQRMAMRMAIPMTTIGIELVPALARAAGADHVILYGKEDVARQVRELTGGKGVEVSFDGVGLETWETSLTATARRGLIVSYGNASGPVSGVNLATLAQKGSLYVSRPTLFDYYHNPAERLAGAEYVFDMFRQGVIEMTIGQRYALEDAAQAHRDLEARKTIGSSVLMPSGIK
jgi:hypothetical protein